MLNAPVGPPSSCRPPPRDLARWGDGGLRVQLPQCTEPLYISEKYQKKVKIITALNRNSWRLRSSQRSKAQSACLKAIDARLAAFEAKFVDKVASPHGLVRFDTFEADLR